MDRREMLGVMGAGAAGLLLTGGTAHADHKSQLSPSAKSCIKACHECATICDETSHHCLKELEKGSGNKEAHAKAHHLTMDCAAICHLTASFIARQSPVHGEVCEACADVCRKCAEACAKETSDEIMSECARICRECEQSCREMAKSAGSH